jgi:hypothetical protein
MRNKNSKLSWPKRVGQKITITFLTPYSHNWIMSDWTLKPLPHFAVYRDQLMALGIVPGDPDSATKAFVDLKTELDIEKAAQKATQIEVDVLSRAVKNLKIWAIKFTAQILTLEDKVKYLENKVVDGLNEVRA